MWILLLIFNTISFADELSSEKYCFSRTPVQSAKQKFSMIQVPSDIVNTDSNCLMVQMRPHRRELIQRYLLSSFPDATVDFSSEDLRRDPCKLKVEREKAKSVDDLNIDLAKNGGQIIKIDTKGSGSDVMQIQTLKDFELSLNQDEIIGECRMITPDRYNISIQVRKNPKPIIPVNLPPGTIVVLNQPPPDQQTSVLKTELQLNRGDRINIGEVVKSLKDKNSSVDIKPNIEAGTTNQTTTESVYLSLQ